MADGSNSGGSVNLRTARSSDVHWMVLMPKPHSALSLAVRFPTRRVPGWLRDINVGCSSVPEATVGP